MSEDLTVALVPPSETLGALLREAKSALEQRLQLGPDDYSLQVVRRDDRATLDLKLVRRVADRLGAKHCQLLVEELTEMMAERLADNGRRWEPYVA